MSDIVEQLRREAKSSRDNGVGSGWLEDKAADKIERLQMENTELVEALDNWMNGVSHADWCGFNPDKPQDCICGRVTIDHWQPNR